MNSSNIYLREFSNELRLGNLEKAMNILCENVSDRKDIELFRIAVRKNKDIIYHYNFMDVATNGANLYIDKLKMLNHSVKLKNLNDKKMIDLFSENPDHNISREWF